MVAELAPRLVPLWSFRPRALVGPAGGNHRFLDREAGAANRGPFSSRTRAAEWQPKTAWRAPSLGSRSCVSERRVAGEERGIQHQVFSRTKKAKGDSELDPEKVEHGEIGRA